MDRKNKILIKYHLKETAQIIAAFIIPSIIFLLLREDAAHFPLGRAVAAAVIFGLLTSVFELVISERVTKKYTFRTFILVATIYYYFSYTFVLLMMGYATLIFKQGKTFAEAFSSDVFEVFPDGIGEILVMLTMFTFFITYMRLSSRVMGHNVVRNYLRGKYHRPVSEERIFLFVDLKSSTAFAEKLGHIKYSELIQEIYLSLDLPVLATEGELYQYVGDEFVMIWEPEKGIRKNNCIDFYFQFQEKISEKEKFFLEKFGVIPEFKAGLHFGEVSIVEIGSLKRDIAYHGDPINTTSRIMHKCKELNENLVISADLLSQFKNLDEDYMINSLGIYELKGKSNIIGLFGIKEKTS